jgi:hypothetical protein
MAQHCASRLAGCDRLLPAGRCSGWPKLAPRVLHPADAADHLVLQVPGGAKPFPAGTIVSAAQVFPGQLAQCTGRFPYPNPAPYALPSNGVQLFQAPNGGKCAGQFSRFYQGLGPDGGFVVQCTN